MINFGYQNIFHEYFIISGQITAHSAQVYYLPRLYSPIFLPQLIFLYMHNCCKGGAKDEKKLQKTVDKSRYVMYSKEVRVAR